MNNNSGATQNLGNEAKTRVLVVDDEEFLADLLAEALSYEGFEVHTANDGFSAISLAKKIEPQVLVLDIMMPGLDGFEVLKRIRRDFPSLPVLFLTAKDSVDDKVAGLLAGGDDYLTKPFSLKEVAARLIALLRRSHQAPVESELQETILEFGDLYMNIDAHEVTRGGTQIQLTAKEFELLSYLMENAGRVVSKTQILDAVWQFDFNGNSNVVELYISYLRRKIDKGREPIIHTIRNVGYILKTNENS
ncbi:MAG: response regulator transcription factor [Arcanobacterium sp.]|nr:response regulator transcription factor [Arcanobacterium sp.]